MFRSSLTLVLALAVWLIGPDRVRADDGACSSSENAFALDMSVEFAPDVRERCLSSLRAALARSNVALCTGPSSLPRVSIRLRAGHVARIEAQDGPNIVARELDTDGLPEDALGDVLAVATEELLRATWLEPLPASPPASAPVDGLPTPRVSASKVRLGGRGATEHYGAGATLIGADLVLRLGDARYGAQLSAGVREGTSTTTRHGSVAPRSLGAELLLVQPLLRRGRFALELPFGLACSYVELRAQADPGHAGRTRAAIALVGWVSLAASVNVAARVRLHAALSGGYTLRGASGFDEGERVTGVAGYGLRGELGLLVSLGGS